MGCTRARSSSNGSLAHGTAAAPTSEGTPSTGQEKRQSAFRRTLQLLSQWESAIRRASWKSGAQLSFPMLFGHMSLTTHRCWTVFLRRAQFLARESWSLKYGQAAIQQEQGDAAPQVTSSIMSVRCMFSLNQAGRPSVVISEPTVYNSTP